MRVCVRLCARVCAWVCARVGPQLEVDRIEASLKRGLQVKRQLQRAQAPARDGDGSLTGTIVASLRGAVRRASMVGVRIRRASGGAGLLGSGS
jgi:hypothetical protein